MTVSMLPWKAPRPKPELQPATDEQAREYMSWFVNRRTYTRQKDKPDPESGKYFFYQARNFETKERLALDTETVRKHLAGEMTIGLYAINPKTQSSKWVAIDGDYADAYLDLRLLRWELQQDGVQALVEMSRRGAHLWILFEEPLPAKLCLALHLQPGVVPRRADQRNTETGRRDRNLSATGRARCR
jgi:hypothetical protein